VNDRISNKGFFLLVFVSFIWHGGYAQSKYDSIKPRLPKHYFNTLITFDHYQKPSRDLRPVDAFNRRLKTYGIKQNFITFSTPLLTKNHEGWDSLRRGNSHLLLTGNILSLQPEFEGIRDHRLAKFGIGLRYIYNTGKKGLWFIDVSPFVTRDASFASNPYWRLASTIVYSHNASMSFNWRVGVTKSFLWGNRYYLPFLGIRIGRLDRVNLSIQIPRMLSLFIPLSPHVVLTLYSKAQGGMFNFANSDTLYYRGPKATLHFARYELNHGLRADIRIGKYFDLFFAAGITTGNNFSFYSERANQQSLGAYNVFLYSVNAPVSPFLNAGFTLKLGKTRSYYNDKNLYEAFDLNNVLDQNGQMQIPLKAAKAGDMNLEAVRDLIDYNDF
jgi:hypothetical protein